MSKTSLSDIINNSDAIGRVAKWGIELAAFEITYKRHNAIKSQALADFIADWTEMPDDTPMPEPKYWVMHFDGSKLLNGSGAGVLLQTPTGEKLHYVLHGSKILNGSGAGVLLQLPTGEKLHYVLQIHFEATNNMAEYEALIHGLRVAKDIGIKYVVCCGDSDLVAQQVAGTWNARNPMMAAYRDEVDEIAKSFLGYEVK